MSPTSFHNATTYTRRDRHADTHASRMHVSRGTFVYSHMERRCFCTSKHQTNPVYRLHTRYTVVVVRQVRNFVIRCRRRRHHHRRFSSCDAVYFPLFCIASLSHATVEPARRQKLSCLISLAFTHPAAGICITHKIT